MNTYQDLYLRPAFDGDFPHLYERMVQASLAHVLMLRETGVLPVERADLLLRGLAQMAADDPAQPAYDGSFEDTYYLLEERLAAACGIPTSELDVQLARSRNDLDVAVLLMDLRDALLGLGAAALALARAVCDVAHEQADALIVGYTHRRPAQPTTIGHVLAGYAETVSSGLRELVNVYDEVNVSPLGACAFTGTDLPIDPDAVARRLGFQAVRPSTYEAIAGADVFMRAASLYARLAGGAARLAKVLSDWVNAEWIEIPVDFTQGSSIMPNKRNPVVLEHLWSMAMAAVGDQATVAGGVATSWFEDTNNATLNTQDALWRSGDRTTRALALLGGFVSEVRPLTLPSVEWIVGTGATATLAAEALARTGVPWRAAHGAIKAMVFAHPDGWSADDLAAELTASGVSSEGAQAAARAFHQPAVVLERVQAGGPGVAAVRDHVGSLRSGLDDLDAALAGRREQLAAAAQALAAESHHLP